MKSWINKLAVMTCIAFSSAGLCLTAYANADVFPVSSVSYSGSDGISQGSNSISPPDSAATNLINNKAFLKEMDDAMHQTRDIQNKCISNVKCAQSNTTAILNSVLLKLGKNRESLSVAPGAQLQNIETELQSLKNNKSATLISNEDILKLEKVNQDIKNLNALQKQ